jgi:hypothetical protein
MQKTEDRPLFSDYFGSAYLALSGLCRYEIKLKTQN